MVVLATVAAGGGRGLGPNTNRTGVLPDEKALRIAMIVCSCNVLSDGQVRACLNPGAACPRTAAQVYECLGCSPKCGRCARTIRGIVAAALGEAHACSSQCAAACPIAQAAHHAPTHVAPASADEAVDQGGAGVDALVAA